MKCDSGKIRIKFNQGHVTGRDIYFSLNNTGNLSIIILTNGNSKNDKIKHLGNA